MQVQTTADCLSDKIQTPLQDIYIYIYMYVCMYVCIEHHYTQRKEVHKK